MINIPWKTFITERHGVKLEVRWWMHDFSAKYKVGDAVLNYGRHIMAMCPMKYSEEWLKNKFEKEGLYASFKEAGEIIINQEAFFEATKTQFALTRKEQVRRLVEVNNQLHELKQKYKSGDLSQTEYQNRRESFDKKKRDIGREYYDICNSISEGIAVVNEHTRRIIISYLESLWRNCCLPMLYAWKIYVPGNDDFYIKEQVKFENELRHGHYDFEKIPSKTDKSKCIYFLPNVTKEDSKTMSDYFHYVYNYRAFQKNLAVEERQKELDDFLVSKNLKDEYPILLSKLSENFFKRHPEKTPEQLMAEIKVYFNRAASHNGKQRWLYRGRMYHHPLYWELEDGLKNEYYEIWKEE